MVIMAQKTNPFLNAMNELAEDWSMVQSMYFPSLLLIDTFHSCTTAFPLYLATRASLFRPSRLSKLPHNLSA